jgi:peptidoglycan/LPS O-acetylase OafA/YrhL
VRRFLGSHLYLLLLPTMLAINMLGDRADLCPLAVSWPFGQALIGLCSAALILRVTALPEGLVGGVLNSRPFVIMGILSYSLYIWQ